MLEYNVTRDDFESNDDWAEFIYDLNNDVNGPYYGTANVTGSYTLRPGYIMSFYQRGTMDALALQKMFSVIDPNNNLFPSLLEQNGLTDQYNADVEFLSEVNRWLTELENFLRGDQAEDEDGRFRAIEARDWRELLEKFKDGEATVRQVRDFFENVSYLPELEGWNDYEQEILDTDLFNAPQTWEEVKKILKSNGYSDEEIAEIEASVLTSEGGLQNNPELAGILRDLGYDDSEWWEAAGEGEQTFEDYANEVGEGVANTAKGLYDELKDKITGCVGSPLDCIKQIGTAILDAGGIPEECQNMGDPWFCTEKGPDEGGKPCWKDCVSFNLPGLPIPDIPLPPGVVDVGTYRDFENAVKTVGKTIGDIIDGNDSCGPNGDQECTVGQVLEDIGDWARETWEGVFSGVDDTTVDDVLDWLKGILGPVTAGIIWTEIEEEVEQVIGVNLPITGETKDCTDEAGEVYATVGIDQECPEPPPIGASFDCASVNKSGGMVEREAQCGGCLQGYDPDGQGGCIEAPIKCPGEQVYDELTGECKDPEPGFVEGDPCKTEAGESGTYNAEGGCVADPVEPTPETGIDCTQPKPTGFAGVSWEYACGDTHCTDGSLISDHPNGDCSIPIGTETPEPAPEAGSPECDQQDRVTNPDGSCGECKPGFTPDPEGFDQCIQAPPECNDCSCAEYAAANPAECTTCPEGESYCASTGQCEAEGACPAAEEAEEDASTGGGSVGGSGGRSMFAPMTPVITASPQLLTRQDFPITDFLAGIFTNSTGGRNV